MRGPQSYLRGVWEDQCGSGKEKEKKYNKSIKPEMEVVLDVLKDARATLVVSWVLETSETMRTCDDVTDQPTGLIEVPAR